MKLHIRKSTFFCFVIHIAIVSCGQFEGLTKELLNDMSKECIQSVRQWAPKITLSHSAPIVTKHILQQPDNVVMPAPNHETVVTDYIQDEGSQHYISFDENENQFPREYSNKVVPVNMPAVAFSQAVNPWSYPRVQFEGPVKGIKKPTSTKTGVNRISVMPPRIPSVLPAGWPAMDPGNEEQVIGPVRLSQPLKKKPVQKEETVNDMMAAFKTAGKDAMEVAWGAIVSEEVTKRVASKLHLNKESIAKELPDFDISDTEIIQNCKTPLENNFNNLDDVAKSNLPIPKCAYNRYRAQNGFCNNLLFMRRGNAMVKFNRGLPPDYSDGISSPRVGKSGKSLPSARIVTNYIVRDGNRPDRQITHLVMQWGQFIDHDISHTSQWTDSDNGNLDCCDHKNLKHPQCFPIQIPSDDPFYSKFGNHCMPLTRSLPAPRPGCTLGPREQLNQITSFIDASNIYGSSVEKTHSLREHRGGRLKVMRLAGSVKEVLPNNGGDPSSCPHMEIHRVGDECSFEAGDSRLNLKVSLTTLHIIWLREHNRIAAALSELNPHWNDEIIFQETRRIVGAMMQQIIYAEYLPWLLGDAMKQWDLELLPEGYYNNYDVFTDPGVYNEFATAAYRYGHSLVNAKLERYDYYNSKIPANDTWISDHIFKPFDLYYPGRIDEYLRGLLIDNAQTFDNLITSQLTNWLFKPHKNAPGLDLAAINIQRGRDHGIPGYNYWRSLCGLKQVKNFQELEQYMIPGQAQMFSQIYEYVDDIDLFPAGISEIPVKNGIIGPVFACIIGKQFESIRQGDRFWYENLIPLESGLRHGFTPEQLAEIRSVKLSKVICVNADAISIIQVNALLHAHRETNHIVRCQELRPMDLRKWKNADDVPVRRPKSRFLVDFLPLISPSSQVPLQYRG